LKWREDYYEGANCDLVKFLFCSLDQLHYIMRHKF